MVADTTTPSLQFLLQGTGNNNNAWGQNLNDQVIGLAEQAIAGVTRLNVTGGTIVLSNDQARSASILLVGALTSILTIVVPTHPKQWRFLNLTSGNFVTLVKTATGQASNLPQGCTTNITCIDNDSVYRGDLNKVGELFFYAGQTAPYGAIECDNSLKKRAEFVDVFRAIGTTWGSSDSTDFRVPPGADSGRFLRSRSSGVPVGTLQANQNKSHVHTGSGTTNAQSNDHYHTGSGTTGSESHYHTHVTSGQTAGISTGHVHSGSGTTGTQNQSLSHAHQYTAATQPSAGQPGGQWGMPTGFGTGTTSPADIPLHNHSFSFTTGAQSADHSHSFSGGSTYEDVVHFHSFSFASAGISASHTHGYSFTTSTGTADGTEARPEALVGILCIRY